MDKLIQGENGSATITNDGATVLNLLQVKHPAAALLVDVAQSQDLEVSSKPLRVYTASSTPLGFYRRVYVLLKELRY